MLIFASLMQEEKTKTKYNIIGKIFRIVGKSLLGLLLGIYILIAILNTTIFQSLTGAIASSFFSKEFNTKVSIGAINISPFIHAGLKDVYLESQQGDTILYASYIEANLLNIKSTNHFVIRNAIVDDVVFYMDMGEKGLNFQFIIDYFKSDKPKDDTPSKPFILEVKDVRIKDTHFRLRNLSSDIPVKKGMFAHNYIEAKDINLKGKNFKLNGADISIDLQYFEAKERCGVNIEELSGHVEVGAKGISLQNSKFKTQYTELDWDAAMTTTSYHTYSYFLDSVQCRLNIRSGSYVGLQDACYWTDAVQDAKQRVYLQTKVNGTVSNMDIEDIKLKTGQTFIQTSGKITGLPHIDNTIFNLNIEDISTSIEDYYAMKLGSMVPQISFPDMLSRLGLIDIKGDFAGSIANFDAKMHISTDLGIMDLLAKAEKEGRGAQKYMANILSPSFNVGLLLNNKMLGQTNIMADAQISLADLANMKGGLVARLNNFHFNGCSYNEVNITGDINGYDIDAQIDLQDELANLLANCNINYGEDMSINLDADLKDVDLHAMNLFSFSDTTTKINANLKADIQNLDLNNLNGLISFNDLQFKTKEQVIDINNLNLKMHNDSIENRITLLSDILDISITGQYTIASITEDINYLLENYIPDISAIISDSSQTEDKSLNSSDNYFAKSDLFFDSKIKDISLIKTLFDLDMNMPKAINIQGHINKENLLYCMVKIPDFAYSQMHVDSAALCVKTYDGKVDIDLNSNKFALSQSQAFKDVAVAIGLESNQLNLLLRGSDQEDDSTNARVQFNSYITNKGLQGNFNDTYFNIKGEKIYLNNNHIIGIANKIISLMNFEVACKDSKITLDGLVSQSGKLKCNFQDVDLSLLNPFFESMNLKLQGTLNKDIEVNNILDNMSFTSNLQADNIAVNDVFLGKAWLNVDNKISPDVFNTYIRFLYKADNKTYLPLQIVGTISPNQDQQLDLTLNMHQFDISIINSFISSFASDLEGTLSCENMEVRGKFTSPEIHGKLMANNVGLRINMLNTKYWFTDDIEINNNRIIFEDFTLRDAQKNKISINGYVAHNNFSSFDINLNAIADKIKILDTKANSGQMYYGTAYASANMNIIGDSTMISITGSAKTEPGTSLTVPVTSKTSTEEHTYINFTNNATSNTDDTKQFEAASSSSMGYNISIDLNVNPNAKLFIPMDFTQLKGDLAASGNGDLRLDINSNGKFSMVGGVEIDNGTFKFNIMDVMERQFIIEQGGSLTWDGEPAGGVMDITAIYKTKTSLSSLLGASYSRPVDVESIIHLTGEMTNPQPSFDINLPNTDEQTTEQVFMQIDKTDDKVMLEQTASILLTNQFYYSQGGYETTALQSGVTSSVMGMAFSQLSGMITNMVRFVDVGLNYTTGNQTLTDQVDVNLSKSFGKWEISVNSTFGGDDQTYTTSEASNFIGDVSAKYKYTDNLRFEVFNHSNANDFTKYNISPYTQGAKVVYKKDYNSIKDIFVRKKKNKSNKKQTKK